MCAKNWFDIIKIGRKYSYNFENFFKTPDKQVCLTSGTNLKLGNQSGLV